MQYTALYRKLRPDVFSGVIGQEHIIRTLKNQIETERVSHAYLFCGTRGTGKTSTAKIFAKAINCSNPRDGEPCGECRSCREVSDEISVNVIEMDAASNNGVDDIRDIREEVKYPPVNGKFRVYIIDEVHMLSTPAFNALLKTLEEPPEHVVFILATTDPQKVPPTIHSRCQRFDFRRISQREMADRLGEYMAGENIDVEPDALRYVAGISDGAMRDAINILDQCSSFYYGEKITLEKALDITGSVDNTVFFQLTNALIEKNSIACINLIEDIAMRGRDISQFVTELIVHLRNVLILSAAPGAENALDFSPENAQKYLNGSKNIDQNTLIRLITSFSALSGKLKYASNDRILLEVCCIQICNPVQEYERPLIATPRSAPPPPPAPTVKKKAVPDDFQSVLARWDEFTARFAGMEGGFLRDTKAGYLENDYLYIVCSSVSAVSILKKKEDLIQKRLEEYFGKVFILNLIFKDTYADIHKKQYGSPDDFSYTEIQAIADIKNDISMEIKVE